MYDFRNILVNLNVEGKLVIFNSTVLPLIGKGKHGALFNLLDGRCVKIFAQAEDAMLEGESYIKSEGSEIIPKLYEIGRNFIVMEYVEGLNLRTYIAEHGCISEALVKNLIFMFQEMKRLGFRRIDESLRHIIVKRDETIKVVDHFYAYILEDTKPAKFFKQLDDLGMLIEFLAKTKKLDRRQYEEWRDVLPEYFKESRIDL